MNLASIPANVPFLETLATAWLAAHEDPSRGLILLPTRRAARSLADAFLRAGNGRPMLLPRITALGALDETPLALSGALSLPPAITAAPRLAGLAKLIMRMPADLGGATTIDQAWRLAVELASLMDQADRAELDLTEALQRAAEAEHAAHWQITLWFLEIVTQHWPAWLATAGLMNPAERQRRLLDAQSAAWADAPPTDPVWAAGMTGGTLAIARLLRVIAHLPTGRVILPGLDTAMSDTAWEALSDSHPQAGIARLLAGLDARRGDVAPLDGIAIAPAGRVGMLSDALLPASALGQWLTKADHDISDLHILRARDQQHEAAAIALILRDALQSPGATAALITPDRTLAGLVSAQLLRWGVIADDSAGEPLAETPPSVFLRLIAAAIEAELAPVALLAVLKHPLAAAGLATADCRARARALEITCLRGPRPPAGITGLREVTAKAPPDIKDFLGRLEACLEPALRQAASPLARPDLRLAALIEAAEALAATDALAGPARLWGMEEGEALATALSEALAALADLPDQPPYIVPSLLDALLAGHIVRSRRALRGRDGGTEHPRIHIWGLLEARLQTADTIVAGGLVETIWPPATDPGPWLSRGMRARAGLPSPEEAIGQAAHDFASAVGAARHVVLSAPLRRDGAPAVPARWISRLMALLAGQGQALVPHPAASWALQLDQPIGDAAPVAAPAPRPAVALRPRRLSVTEIETWLADPYAIYARRILGIKVLDPLEQSTDAADYGSLVHTGIQNFLRDHGTAWPADGRALLQAAMLSALTDARLRPALAEWWTPRLRRIAAWVADAEIARRSARRITAIGSELSGNWLLPSGFTLHGRADRIERRADGSLAILDYKTGTPPSQKHVDTGTAPQLLLEAAMAAAGAFGAGFQGPTDELIYWHLTGGADPGVARPLFKSDQDAIAAAVTDAGARLQALIDGFDNPDRAYLAQPHPGRLPRFPAYAQLARVAEWRLVEDSE